MVNLFEGMFNCKSRVLNNKTSYISIILFYSVYIFSFLFFCSMLSPLYGYSTWVDVNIYHVIGRGMIDGKVIYKDLFDHKGPIIFFIYGLGSLISRTSFLGVFFIEVFLFTITSFFIYLTARLFCSSNSSILAGLFFPLIYVFYSFYGGAAEDFILVSEIISMYFFLRYFKSTNVDHNPKYSFVYGIMIAITFFLKLNLILFWFFPLLYICIYLIYNKRFNNLLKNIICFFLGGGAVIFIVLSYFIYNNAFEYFIDGYFRFNAIYATQESMSMLDVLKKNILSVNSEIVISFLLSLSPLLYFSFSSSARHHKAYWGVIFLLSFLLQFFSFLFSYYIMGYYYLVFVVYIILLAIIFISHFDNFLKKYTCFFIFFTALSSLSIGIYKTSFFSYSFDNLLNKKVYNKEIDVFKAEIEKAYNPSLLCLGFDKTLSIYSVCDINPNVRFFFLPNIRIEAYPSIYEAHVNYIKSRDIDYLVMDDFFRYYSDYIDVIEDNYDKISSYPNHVGSFVSLYKKRSN